MNWGELLWPGLESVPRSIATPELRHQSLLLSRLLRLVLVLCGLSVTIQSLLVPRFLANLLVLGSVFGLLLLALILNHRGQYHVAASTAIGVMLAGCFGMLVLDPQDVLVFAYLTIPLFLARLFLFERTYQAITAAILIAVFVAPWVLGAPAIQAVVGGLYVTAMAALFNIARRHRNALEVERRGALAASENELRTILDHMQDTYYRTDTDGRIVHASVSATRLLGYAPNEMLGLRLADFYVDPDGRAKFLAALQAAGGELENYEAELRQRDGTVLWVSTNAHFVRDDAGKILGVEGTVRNVTERKRAELAMRDSESRYRTIVETTQEGIWTIGADSRTTFVNRKMAEMLGYTVEAMQGRPLFDFMDEEGRRLASENIERRKAGIAEQHDFRFMHASGRVVLAELNTSPLTDERGRYAGALAMVTDITERKRAELALRESEAHLRTVISNLPVVLYTLDREGVIRFSEGKGLSALQLKPGEVVGRSVFEMYREHPEICSTIRRALAGEPIVHVVTLGPLTFEVHYTPSFDANGEVKAVIGLAINITDRQRAERALRESEQILNKAQEVAHIGSWWWDIAANRVICSRELLRLYGLPPELTGTAEEIFARIAQSIHPADREQFQIAMQSLLETGQTGESIEYRVVLPDGQVRTLLAYPEVLRDADGKPRYTYGALQDITERKRNEQGLLEMARAVTVSSSEAFFPGLVEHLARALEADYAFVGALAPDKTDRIRTIAVQAQGQRAENFEYSLSATPCANVMVQGTCAYARDVQKLFPDDHMLVEMGVHAYVGTPLVGTDGQALGLIVVMFRQPIARETAVASTLEIFAARATSELQRLRAETQMRKLSSAIEQTADSVVITDPHGVIEYVNPAFERSTGYSAAEALGQTPRLVRSGKQGQSFYRKLWNTILAGEVFGDVLINRRKDGTFYYEEKTITPLKDADGQITHFISTGKDVTERMQTQEKLEFMAQHDALTELPNRALLLDRLKQSVARARWHRRMVAVLFVDLDRFKTINDTLGHEAGDQLLQQLGVRFSNNVREGDTVARFGGDEFVILLGDVASDKDIGAVAQKILDALKGPFDINGQSLYITASIGISLFPNDGEDSSTLLKHADIAMYRAKELGKNTYQFYSADMSARAFERLSLENSLRHAIERNEFVLHYQPQFDVSTGRIIGVEALLRWQHPDFGLVPPADFIALLEETGLIVPAGEWVLEEAGRQFRVWHESGYRNLRIAVNLSPRQVQSGALLTTVQRVLANGPEESGWLELEITEGLLVQQSPGLMEFFETLRTLGVRLAVDDFGTGYSSLAYLRRLPIDTLKIDRSFVRDVPGDADDSAITTTIIAMAQSLRLEVIAEGVENEAQRDFLSAYGCRRMQGYLFARPQPAAELSQMLASDGSGPAPG